MMKIGNFINDSQSNWQKNYKVVEKSKGFNFPKTFAETPRKQIENSSKDGMPERLIY